MPTPDQNPFAQLLKSKMSQESYRKLAELENEALFSFVGQYTELCQPDSVYMCDDCDEDAEYIRQNSLLEGEETPLAKEGHTIHYDGYNDQGRAPGATKNLVSKELVPLMGALLAKEREEGLAEVRGNSQRHDEGQTGHRETQLRRPDTKSLLDSMRADDRFFLCRALRRPALSAGI